MSRLSCPDFPQPGRESDVPQWSHMEQVFIQPNHVYLLTVDSTLLCHIVHSTHWVCSYLRGVFKKDDVTSFSKVDTCF